MTDDNAGVSRRAFLRTAAGATVASGVAAGNAVAQKKPQFGSWLQGVDGGFKDARGSKEVTVQVGADGNGGAYAFSPAGLWIDSGTTVTFEWTGEGGAHNVVGESGPAADMNSGSPVAEPGVHFEHTFEKGGITNYYCDPHKALGMKGAIAVGDGVPTTGGGGGGGASVPTVPESAKVLGIGAVGAMLSALGFGYFFVKYGGNYEASE